MVIARNPNVFEVEGNGRRRLGKKRSIEKKVKKGKGYVDVQITRAAIRI